ncbi:MAG: carbohydrate-binding protein [Clostridiaceae bacterium]|nr:carbohydrate-binding protein [Clostridiaceae bacterium]
MRKGKRILSMVLIFSLCISLFGVLPVQVAAEEDGEEIPIYMDTSYSFIERAADLVARMTLAEKASQLNTSAPAIPRLGIKANNWWQEALHGAAWTRAVSFPSSLSMSLTWDPQLLFETASIIGDECRAYNTTSGRPLSNFCPTINIQRDPRWGRNDEGYGEDPYLVAVLGAQYVNGIQGNLDTENVTSPSGEKYLKTIATLKHYAANNSEQNRYTGSSDVSDRSLREYYTYAFRYITENANPESVMSAYNRVNGVPCAANTYLLDTLLRKSWNFGGYVVSDCEGISWMRNGHNWIPSNPPGVYTQRVTMPQATAFALMAGNDLACNWTQSGSYGGDFSNNLAAAIDQKILTDNGIMTEDIADRALVRLFTARMKTGEFDPKTFEYSKYTVATHVESAYNVAKSLESSRNAIVLLKNDDNTLPIDLEKVKSIVVLGKFLDRCELGDSNYAGSPTTRVSFRQGLTNALKAKGFDTENNLKFINTSGRKVEGYIFNIRGFTINGKSYNAIDATTLNGCRKETNNIGYINDGAYAIFENVDVGSEVVSFTADVATNGTNISFKPVVEVRLDGPDGKLLAKAVCQPTSGWQVYTTNQGTVTGELIHDGGTRTICLVFTTDQSTGPEWDMEAIKNADLAIYLAGTGKTSELEVAGENRDRANMNFPANQVSEIKQVIQANPNTVVAIQAVGTMNISDFVNDAKAILFTCYNGQFQGQAMAEVLLGDHNANGRLSFTWYADESQLPNVLDYDIYPSETKYGRTYQYFKGDILYPFGYGLSYTTFEYSNFRINKKELDANDEFEVSVDVKNTGSVKGKEVVQLYVTTPDAPAELMRPIKRLRAFKNIELEPGETKTVTLTVKVPDLAFFNEELGRYVVDNGRYGVQISRSSADKDIQFQEFINVTGTLKHELNVVTAIATQEGDEEKDIPERVLFGKNKVVIPKVCVAMNDETLYGHVKKGDFRPFPEGMTIQYSSNRPEIVSVDENGVIRTNDKGGVATITATVTYNGVSKSDDFVVYVYDPVTVNPIEDKLTGEEVTISGSSLLPEITITVTDPDGTVIYSESVSDANYSKTFKLANDAKEGVYTVVVGNGEVSATTTFNVTKNPNIGEYIINTTFSMDSLRGNELIKANVNVKNIGTFENSVLVIVTLYDGNNRMVNLSYISKVIIPGKEETLTAGFKLPVDITGHTVSAFVWDGEDLSSTTMQPLSNVTSLSAYGLAE